CRRLSALEPAPPELAAAVVVSDRLLPALPPGWVVYRPGTLALGVGCSRGAPPDEIEALLRRTLAEAGLSLGAARTIGTVEFTRDEPGLSEAARRLGLAIRYFSREALAAVAALPTPSEAAMRHLGIPGVAEPAAILAAGGGGLVVTKRKSAMATVA